MSTTSTIASLFIPGGKIESSGEMSMYLKCDTASSGVGLSSAVMPLYSPGYSKPSGSINLLLEASNQVGLWGYSLYGVWGAYNIDNWSSWPPSSLPASGYTVNNISMSISGQRIMSFNAVMPLYQPVLATGNMSGSVSMFIYNQESISGYVNMYQLGHDVYSSGMSMFIEGGYEGSSGTMSLVATGVGHADGSLDLATFSFSV